MQNNTTQKIFTVQVDYDLLKSFKNACADNDRTASQIVRDFMRDYVSQNRQQKLRFEK